MLPLRAVAKHYSWGQPSPASEVAQLYDAGARRADADAAAARASARAALSSGGDGAGPNGEEDATRSLPNEAERPRGGVVSWTGGLADGLPCAELWVGTHPSGPSTVAPSAGEVWGGKELTEWLKASDRGSRAGREGAATARRLGDAFAPALRRAWAPVRARLDGRE